MLPSVDPFLAALMQLIQQQATRLLQQQATRRTDDRDAAAKEHERESHRALLKDVRHLLNELGIDSENPLSATVSLTAPLPHVADALRAELAYAFREGIPVTFDVEGRTYTVKVTGGLLSLDDDA